MRFGLTNARATFQGLMNEVFKPFLCHFVLVFFDNILAYSTDLSTHVMHLRRVLEVLQSNQLYAKSSKCCFGVTKIEYLGHLISSHGVRANPSNSPLWPIGQFLAASNLFGDSWDLPVTTESSLGVMVPWLNH